MFYCQCNANISQDRPAESWADKSQSSNLPPSVPAPTSQALAVSDYSLSMNRDTYFLDRDPTLDSKLRPSTLSLYGQDPGLGGLRTSVAGRTGPIVTQVSFMDILCLHLLLVSWKLSFSVVQVGTITLCRIGVYTMHK